MTNEAFGINSAQRADALLSALFGAINRGEVDWSDLATRVRTEHPTLIGRLIKAVGVGVVRHSLAEPNWRPFDDAKSPRMCAELPVGRTVRFGSGMTLVIPAHPAHDGRLDCATVVGAELISGQSFI